MQRESDRIERVFSDALARPAHERAAFLDGACNGDAPLRDHIFALLAAHAGPDSVLQPITAARATLPKEQPGDAIGHYKLLQKIGEGGCGVVWMAEQEEPVRRRVALKVIKLGMDTKAVVARFEAERQALAMMDHPCIAKVHDAGSTDTGRPYFVMELVRGIPITKYCDENHLTPKERLELFIKVCQAIQHAHQKGVIHRDIKPSNILVTVNDGAPTPKVIDFGIAKATQGRLTDATVFTAFEQFIGTPVYMSPEQAEMSSLDIDTRSDIYSLGVLLYELLTGRPPFDPKTFAQAGVDQIRKQIREVDPPRPSARLRTLDAEERTTIARLRGTAESKLSIALRGDLDWVVMRCIEKDRTRRYDTANGLVMDIERYLRNEPVIARPPSTAYLLGKLMRRHRVSFVAGSLVAVSLIGGIAFASVALLREKAARAKALRAERLADTGRAKAEDLLTFIFTDLGEHLGNHGQLRVLKRISERIVGYYDSLPAELQTRDTRASYAFALAGVGSLGWLPSDTSAAAGSLGQQTTGAELARAARIFEELEATGPLTPFMRVAWAAICYPTGVQHFFETKYAEAVSVCERGEKILAPALQDPVWGGWAHRILTLLNYEIAFNRMRSGDPQGALRNFERARASAAEADRRPPVSTRPGLVVTLIMADENEALWRSNRRDEARAMVTEARARLLELAEREPFLASAHFWVAMTDRNRCRQSRDTWQFEEWLSAHEEAQAKYSLLMKVDPKNWLFQGNLAESWSNSSGQGRFGFDWLMRDFAGAARAARMGVELHKAEWTPPYARETHIQGRINWARALAVLGDDPAARQQLQEADAIFKQMLVERPWLTELQRNVLGADMEGSRRQVLFEQLDWPAMRRSAEESLRALPNDAQTDIGEVNLQRVKRAAQVDLMSAAIESGDYVAARRILDEVTRYRRPDVRNGEIQEQFSQLTEFLLQIRVLARSGDGSAACADLTALWPEVERVFAHGPEYAFNQVQTAHALSIRAAIEGTPAEKRAWLDRAAGYLRPIAAAGKLTRYERDVLLAGIEKQLAELPPS